MVKIGRYCEINGIEEVSDLESGMDFRLPQYRREVFLRFYEFHLKYNAHAGAVYYVMPYLFEKLNMNIEQRLWFTFINGCSQNVITSYLIYQEFPDVSKLDVEDLRAWYREHYEKLGWDTDRRYHKNCFEDCVLSYRAALKNRPQYEVFSDLCKGDKYANFTSVWNFVRQNFLSFGRLSTFSYLEYLRIAGINLDCGELFLDDMAGSKSHRSGLCKVLGRDDLDWHKQAQHPYSNDCVKWLTKEAETLLKEASERIDHPDVSYFTLETTLCCYKGWHRVNRRYPNVYNDMFYDRIVHAIKKWKTIEKFQIFWQCRADSLPRHLLLECNKRDFGLDKRKQNHYRLTGEVIMMNKSWSCFTNKYNDYVGN